MAGKLALTARPRFRLKHGLSQHGRRRRRRHIRRTTNGVGWPPASVMLQAFGTNLCLSKRFCLSVDLGWVWSEEQQRLFLLQALADFYISGGMDGGGGAAAMGGGGGADQLPRKHHGWNGHFVFWGLGPKTHSL